MRAIGMFPSRGQGTGTAVCESAIEIHRLVHFGDLDGNGVDDLGWLTGGEALSPMDLASRVVRVTLIRQRAYRDRPQGAEGGMRGPRSAVYTVDIHSERHWFLTRKTSYFVTSAATGDRDGDGRPDIALGYGGDGQVDLHLSRFR